MNSLLYSKGPDFTLNSPGFSNSTSVRIYTSTWVVKISNNITRDGDVELDTFIIKPTNANIAPLDQANPFIVKPKIAPPNQTIVPLCAYSWLGKTYSIFYSSKSVYGILSQSVSYVSVALAAIAFMSPWIYKAIRSFQFTTRLNPEKGITIDKHYLLLGRYDEAIDCYDHVLKSLPNDSYAIEGKRLAVDKRWQLIKEKEKSL